MKEKNIHIKKTIDIELAVPETATEEEIEVMIKSNFLPDGIIKNYDGTYRVNDVTLVEDDDDQDNFLVVEWPESQTLCEYEGFMDNCSLLLSDGFGSATYMVNKDYWYGRLHSGELKKVEFEEAA
jgi:hypothetical protein